MHCTGYRFGGFVLDLGRGALLATNGKEIALRAKSFAFLQLLVENSERLMTRKAIMAALWPNVFVSDDNVVQCVREIRCALGDRDRCLLRVVRKRGYILATTVTPLIPAVSVASAAIERPREAVALASPGPVRSALRRFAPDASLAVSPFQDHGGQLPDFFADSITEDLRIDLSGWASVSACPRTWSQASARSIARTAMRCGIRFLVAGAIRRSGRSVCVSVQLIDCATAMHVWGDRFATDAADLETVRGEISVRLAYTVRLAVIDASADPCVSLRRNGVDAGQLTARGWATFHKTNSRSVAQESLRYFQQALLLEPDSIYATQGVLTVALRNVAEEWSRLDDDIDERLFAVYDRDVNQSLTHQLIGLTRRIQGRLDESLVEFEIARDLDRTSVSAIRLQAYAMIFAGQVMVRSAISRESFVSAPTTPSRRAPMQCLVSVTCSQKTMIDRSGCA
jgi:DNA-binding winged helix-turn-helix (wHTH) protein